ncbi:hypothetical protein [Actinobacillus vicugnae]|uniref:hypothetical protein n=1 Tax=Actinobacillus vicugnae TaxID=2573093 RepID=UPI00123F4E61|nr:hypothetical protein [Actinobacillus vicugnae]
MRQAVENVKQQKIVKCQSTFLRKCGTALRFGDDGYNFLLNNCQDFATEVEKEYIKLERQGGIK